MSKSRFLISVIFYDGSLLNSLDSFEDARYVFFSRESYFWNDISELSCASSLSYLLVSSWSLTMLFDAGLSKLMCLLVFCFLILLPYLRMLFVCSSESLLSSKAVVIMLGDMESLTPLSAESTLQISRTALVTYELICVKFYPDCYSGEEF